MYCGNCGTQLPPESKFCYQCGWNVAVPPVESGQHVPVEQQTPLQYENNRQPVEQAPPNSEYTQQLPYGQQAPPFYGNNQMPPYGYSQSPAGQREFTPWQNLFFTCFYYAGWIMVTLNWIDVIGLLFLVVYVPPLYALIFMAVGIISGVIYRIKDRKKGNRIIWVNCATVGLIFLEAAVWMSLRY